MPESYACSEEIPAQKQAGMTKMGLFVQSLFKLWKNKHQKLTTKSEQQRKKFLGLRTIKSQ